MWASLNTGGDQEMSSLQGMEKEDVDGVAGRSFFYSDASNTLSFFFCKLINKKLSNFLSEYLFSNKYSPKPWQVSVVVKSRNINSFSLSSSPKLNSHPVSLLERGTKCFVVLDYVPRVPPKKE